MHHTYRPAATLRGLPTTLHRPVVGEQPSLLQQGEEEREGVWPEGAGQEGLAGGGSGEQQVECGDEAGKEAGVVDKISPQDQVWLHREGGC